LRLTRVEAHDDAGAMFRLIDGVVRGPEHADAREGLRAGIRCRAEQASRDYEKLPHAVMVQEMEYQRLGSTGLKISRLGLGCGNFGGIGSAPAFFGMGETEAQAYELMDRAFDGGINFFDSADAYGGGRSESFIGRWLKTKGAHVRQQLLLSSKVFNRVGPGPNDRGLSRRSILRQVDASLARLQTDRLDMYLIHEPDPETPLDETLEALDDVRRAGKVLYVGASNVEAWRLAAALAISERRGLARFEWVQNSYSLLDRSAEREIFPLCADRGVGFTAFSPLAGGWLTGKYRAGAAYPEGSRMTLRPEPYRHLEQAAVFGALAALEDEARARGVDVSALAIAWVLGHPRMDAAIIGPRRPEHLEKALEALTIRMDESARARMTDLFAPAS
jgi:aryl-alcohol dehydrogenase-like predicted oxidoreductase